MDKRYQVFISSTFRDLEVERKEVMEAIINLNCFPAGMEMFPAADMEQFDYIKPIIDRSDYYVLIIAGKYGSVADDGISYTEKEYDYAKEKGIPILVFVKKDIDHIEVVKTDNNPELRIKLDKFREKAMKNTLAKFWDTTLELKYIVHDSLTKAFTISPRDGWVKGGEITEVETLRKLEKLREENTKLINENKALKDEIKKKEEIKDIAQGDDEVCIRYSFVSTSGSTYNKEINISWDVLFSITGPSFASAQNITASKSVFQEALLRYLNKDYYRFKINEDDFNTIKIQFDALNLIKYYAAKSTNSGVIEFMQLTDDGREKLKILKIQRKKE